MTVFYLYLLSCSFTVMECEFKPTDNYYKTYDQCVVGGINAVNSDYKRNRDRRWYGYMCEGTLLK